MDKKKTAGHVTIDTPEPSMEDRMKAKRTELVAARERATMELNGLVNQIYVIDQLLNPKPPEPAEKPQEAEEAKGVPMKKGTI